MIVQLLLVCLSWTVFAQEEEYIDPEQVTTEEVHPSQHCATTEDFKHEIVGDADELGQSAEWGSMDPATYCCRQCALTEYCTVWNLDPQKTTCTFYEGDPWEFKREPADGWVTGQLIGAALDHNLHKNHHNEKDDPEMPDYVPDPHEYVPQEHADYGEGEMHDDWAPDEPEDHENAHPNYHEEDVVRDGEEEPAGEEYLDEEEEDLEEF
eukprot:TRINITY_DN51475_c0_g1_i1.p1 TRINITY_DN51475_c0_g1~~TRINITY_DN51475_c0_g1_i1.p1  ORF type:complete len:209 (-),score=25.08 TRINITY_DN51475_c0_g1_i1:1153-1779(-)